MKYLKKFNTDSERVGYEDSENYLEPYVSYVEGDNSVHYNKVETKLIVYYDIQDISAPTTIFTNYGNSVKSIEVDGTLLDSVVTTYQFGSVGEHIIKYEFNDPATVGNSAPLFLNLGTIKRVVIPNTFTSIGQSVFQNCSLTSITIPYNVTSIGSNAFFGCASLISIAVDNGNTVYDSRDNCNAIIETETNLLIKGCENTVIPNTVTSIGDGAFSKCSGLTSVTIPNSVTSIGGQAFGYCSGLTNINIPSGVTSIANYAFQNCSGLTSVTIEATTPPTLGGFVFNNGASGRKIYVPSESVNAYKTATNWSNYAADIEAIQ